VVPPATLTDLDHVDPEFAVFSSHLRKFACLLYPSLVLAKLVTVDIRNVSQVGFPADRTAVAGGLTVELGGPQQVRVSIADVGDSRTPGVHGRERGPAGQPVVHDGTP